MKSKGNHPSKTNQPTEDSSSQLQHSTLVTSIKPDLPDISGSTSTEASAYAEHSSASQPASAPKILSVKRPGTQGSVTTHKLAIPPILLEGDHPGETANLEEETGTEPADQTTIAEPESNQPSTLPKAYGTRELVLTARDPHWLHLHWDFTADQLHRAAAESIDGHLTLRVYREGNPHAPREEIRLSPDITHRFVHVGPHGGSFGAELGYRQSGGKWKSLSVSNIATTPPAEGSGGSEPSFATIPFEVPMNQLVEMAKDAVQSSGGLAGALERLRREGHPDLPTHSGIATSSWTAEQEAALAEILAVDSLHRLWLGSEEITALVQRQAPGEIISSPSLPFSPSMPSSPSSPFGGWGGEEGFWFDVNAELVLYGSTEPNATVTIGGRRIKLKEDGSFTFRFTLPDGEHELPVIAVSTSGNDTRQARLRFVRRIDTVGEIEAHPQDPSLKPPHPESLDG